MSSTVNSSSGPFDVHAGQPSLKRESGDGERASGGGQISSDPGSYVRSFVDQSLARSDFVRLLAQHFQKEFNVGIVAIVSSEYEQPIMLVADLELERKIHRSTIREALSLATATPIASEISLIASVEAGGSLETESAEADCDANLQSVRGFRVELIPAPERLAILLLHRIEDRPSPSTQLKTLRQLSLYGKSIRELAMNFNAKKREPTEVPPANKAAEPTSAPNPTGMVVADTSIRGEISANRQTFLQLHRSLDLKSTAYRIANETRRLIGCDRVSVLVPQGKKLVAQAVSGVAVVDRRSNAIRSIEKLVDRAIVMGRPIVLPGKDTLAPQIQSPLDEYLDQSGATSAVLLPVRITLDQAFDECEPSNWDPFDRRGSLVGVLFLEYFTGTCTGELTAMMRSIASESSVALNNSMEHESILGLSVWKSLGRVKRSSKKTYFVAGAVVSLLMMIASMIIKVDHYVIATGSVEPTQRRQVFAAVDGVVKSIFVSDGESVDVGTPLLELENSELQRNSEAITGQIQTTLQRLASMKAVRLSSDNSQQSGMSRMAVEEQQLQSELINLRAQQLIIQSQQADLIVKSPIEGTVVGWQLEERLSNRPVSRGNLLMSVANDTGPWELKLHLEDRDAGALLDSLEIAKNLDVRFAVATQPERSYAATLEGVATAARVDDTKTAVIDTVAKVLVHPGEKAAEFSNKDVRIGADVTARIYCGERSVLRSWFGDVFDFVNRNVLFYFR